MAVITYPCYFMKSFYWEINYCPSHVRPLCLEGGGGGVVWMNLPDFLLKRIFYLKRFYPFVNIFARKNFNNDQIINNYDLFLQQKPSKNCDTVLIFFSPALFLAYLFSLFIRLNDRSFGATDGAAYPHTPTLLGRTLLVLAYMQIRVCISGLSLIFAVEGSRLKEGCYNFIKICAVILT